MEIKLTIPKCYHSVYTSGYLKLIQSIPNHDIYPIASLLHLLLN